MPGAIKLEQPEKSDIFMDFDDVKAFIWEMDKYSALTGLTDEYQCAPFAAIHTNKYTSLWMHNQDFYFDLLIWPDLHGEIRRYFHPAYYHCRARDSLAACKQFKGVTTYSDAMKHCAQRLPEVSEDKLLDCFIHGLKPMV